MHETLMYLAIGIGLIAVSLVLITAIVIVSKNITYQFGLPLKLQFELLLGLIMVGCLLYFETNNTAVISNSLTELTSYVNNDFARDVSTVLKHLFVSEMEVLLILASLASGYILYVILEKFNAKVNEFYCCALSLVLFTINFNILLQIDYYSSRTIGILGFV